MVGPGAYGGQFDYTKDHGYAPFSSTAERQLGGSGRITAHTTPGPGSYRNKRTDCEVAAEKKEVSTGAFVSGVSRIAKETSSAMSAPGPGSYTSGNAWIKNTHRYKLEAQARRVTFQRTPTAPSVPVRNQSYGYEESGSGELILQQAPTQGHSGVGADTVGPCVYEPKLTAVKTTKTTDFQTSKTKRGVFSVNANPGPGQYQPREAGANIIVEANERHAARKAAKEAARKGEEAPPDFGPEPQMTSNFASKVPLAAAKAVSEEQAVPGPGTYVMKTQFRTKAVPVNQQFFGCSSRRNYEVDIQQTLAAPTWAVTPGPGRYEEKRLGFGSKGLSRPDNVPFRTSSRRFAGSNANAPGPGQYDEENHSGFVNDMNKKVVSRNGVFGSTSERFGAGPGVVPFPVAPGPGTYESQPPSAEDGPTLARLRRKETSAFASTSDRFNSSAGASSTAEAGKSATQRSASAEPDMVADDHRKSRGGRMHVPPPGAYEVPDLWRKSRDPRRRTDKVFISKENRFTRPKQTNVAAPGPGAYEGGQQLRNPIPVQRSSFQSGSARFESHRSVAPGPGMYETEDPNRSIVKRSFNVTVDGVMW